MFLHRRLHRGLVWSISEVELGAAGSPEIGTWTEDYIGQRGELLRQSMRY